MNYAEKLANRLVWAGIVSKGVEEMALIRIIIREAKKEIDSKTLRYWLLSDDDFLSDAVSTVNELLKK